MARVLRRVVRIEPVMVERLRYGACGMPRRLRNQRRYRPRYRCYLECGHSVDRPGPWGRRQPPSPPKTMRCPTCEAGIQEQPGSARHWLPS